MKLKQDKAYLLARIQDCINSYPPDKSWHEKDDTSKPLKDGYKGTKIDFAIYDSYQWFQFGTEMGFIFRKTIQGEKAFGVVITGTRTPVQWVLNFATMKEDTPSFNDTPYGYKTSTGIAMHTGFKAGYDMLMKYLREKTQDALDDGIRTIVGTAHSRGASILQIWALDISKQYADDKKIILPEDINITLVASPRVFNDAGRVSYDKRVPSTVSIINRNDPVAGVPSDGLGYRAVAKKTTYRIGGQWFDVLSPSAWLTGALYLTPSILLNGIGAGVAGAISANDHYPMSYKKNMATYKL